MSLISRLLHAVQSWRRDRGGRKSARRARVSMEQLDHRQLLSVNFTGNVATDFPATTKPGVVVLPNNPSVTHPTIGDPSNPADPLRQLVKVSGFDVNGLRVSYTSADDTLSIGIEQPLSQQASHPGPVIAGDSDNNGNDGVVNPAVTALEGTAFHDFPDFGGSEYMGVFLDLKGTGYANVVAGYAINDARSPKQYQVAQAVVNTNLPPATLPDFGAELPQYEGNVYKVNSPAHPNLEFAITHFSQLYLAETGQPLTSNSVVKLGGFAGSQDDTGIGEAFFPEQSVNIGQATPPPPTPCPPASPPVFINIHENNHLNTVHDELVRVNVLGSSGFDVTKIIPGSVTLGGAHPVSHFTRNINSDEYPDATFVFRSIDLQLPSGYSEAAVSGALTDGTLFSSNAKVFNRDASFYSAAAVLGARQRQAARAARGGGFAVLPNGAAITAESLSLTPAALSIPGVSPKIAASAFKVDMTLPAAPITVKAVKAAAPGPVITIKRREPVVVGSAPTRTHVPIKIQSSLNRYARSVGAVNVKTRTPIAAGGSQ